MQDKLDQSKEKYKRAALLMTEFLNDTLCKKQNILTQDNNRAGSMSEQFAMQNVEDMSREQKVELIFDLLK